jgi:hypothetical protein
MNQVRPPARFEAMIDGKVPSCAVFGGVVVPSV